MTRRTGLVNLESSKNEKLRILDSRSSSLALASRGPSFLVDCRFSVGTELEGVVI